MAVYDKLADKTVIFKVNEHFYQQVYEHPMLSKYFEAVTQEHITNQQTDFITGALGGPNLFCGRPPAKAHPHMFVTDELFELRKSMLEKSLDHFNASEELKVAWLGIDEAFRRTITKKSVDECQGRWPNDPILNFLEDNLSS